MQYNSFDVGVDLQLANIRLYLESKYGSDINLAGKGILASNIVMLRLKTMGYSNIKEVEGWCIYDNLIDCNDRGYNEHTWVELQHNGTKYYIDVTADQFNSHMCEPYPNIICCKGLPHGMCYDKPSFV